jgi:hypothetical protein
MTGHGMYDTAIADRNSQNATVCRQTVFIVGDGGDTCGGVFERAKKYAFNQ